MAYVDGDWTIDRQTGNIRYAGVGHDLAAASYATVIEAHRKWADLADDATSTGNDDELDITDNTPSNRSTDNIITLNAPYNIDATAAEHLYDGSIIQNGGDEYYDGIVNFGNATVQIQIMQDGAVIADDYWNKSEGGTATAGTTATVLEDTVPTWTTDEWIGYTIYNTTTNAQGIISANTATTITAAMYDDDGTTHDWASTNTYLIGAALNSDAASGISSRFMIRTRTGGVDIDGRSLIGTSRRYGNTYGEFNINQTANGNNVLALSDATDLNNSTTGALIQTYTAFANDNAGFDNSQDVDLDTTAEEYYSRWDITTSLVPAAPTINDLYEWGKWITRQSSDATLYGINGELFRGITLQIPVDTPTGTTWTEPESLSWTGGTGQLLAVDNVTASSTTKMWIQLLTGVAPTDGLVISGASASNAVNGTATDRVPLLTFPFIGASTGSSIIGGYGIGIEADDLTASDILFDLDNNQITPPNNVTVSIGGLESGEDYVTVNQRGYRFAYDTGVGTGFVVGELLTGVTPDGTYTVAEIVDGGTVASGYIIISEPASGTAPADNTTLTGGTSSTTGAVNGTPASDINKRQLILNTTLIGNPDTSVVVTTAIPTDTPSAGIVRVQDDNGFYRRLIYTSYTGSTFTISNPGDDEDVFNVVNATAGKNVYVGYKDELSDAATESFTTVYSADRNLFVRVRDGGTAGDAKGIKTFETTVTMGTSGGSATAIRTSDE